MPDEETEIGTSIACPVFVGVGFLADHERRLQARMDAVQAELRDFNYPLNDFLEVSGQMTLVRRSLLERYRMEKLAEEFRAMLTPEERGDKPKLRRPQGPRKKPPAYVPRPEAPRVNPGVREYWRKFHEAKAKVMAASAIKPEVQRTRPPRSLPSYLTMDRPTLPVPVRVVTAEELARM